MPDLLMFDAAVGIYIIGILVAGLLMLRRRRQSEAARWSNALDLEREKHFQNFCDHLERRAERHGWVTTTTH